MLGPRISSSLTSTPLTSDIILSLLQCQKKKLPQPNQRIYICFLPQNITQNKIIQLFSKYGYIQHIRLGCKKDGFTFCYVTYMKIQEARQAIKQMNKYRIGEKMLKVSWALPYPEEDEKKEKDRTNDDKKQINKQNQSNKQKQQKQQKEKQLITELNKKQEKEKNHTFNMNKKQQQGPICRNCKKAMKRRKRNRKNRKDQINYSNQKQILQNVIQTNKTIEPARQNKPIISQAPKYVIDFSKIGAGSAQCLKDQRFQDILKIIQKNNDRFAINNNKKSHHYKAPLNNSLQSQLNKQQKQKQLICITNKNKGNYFNDYVKWLKEKQYNDNNSQHIFVLDNDQDKNIEHQNNQTTWANFSDDQQLQQLQQ